MVGNPYPFPIDWDDVAGNSDSTAIFYTYIEYADGMAPKLTGLPTGKDSTNYRIVGIPYVFPTSGNTMQAIFQDDLDSLNKSNIRMFGLSGSNYSELGASSSIQRGVGYWLLKIASVDIDFGEVTAGNNTPDNPFTMNISTGWNMIGNPYPFDIDWDDVLTANAGASLSQFSIWQGSSGYTESIDKLSMFQGAFVRADANATIQIPMVKYGSGGGRIGQSQDMDHKNPLTDDSWKLNLILESGGLENAIGGIGMHPDALDPGDSHDKIILPRFINYLEIIHEETEYLKTPVTHSIVGSGDNHTWNFTVENNINKDMVTLRWENRYFGDSDREMVLYDLDNEVNVNMRKESSYTFANNGANQFIIRLGGAELLEADGSLFDNAYPNPFTQDLKVRFNLPHTRDLHNVNIDVFSPVGTKVITLASGEMTRGYHEIIWKGQDAHGHEVSSGVYILRLTIDTGHDTRNYVQRVIKR